LQEEVDAFAANGEWQYARPEHFVEFHERLFEQVYGVESPMTVKDRRVARILVSRLLRDSFAGDAEAFSRFLRWTWVKERETEAWRRANRRDGRVLTWSRAFSREKLTEFRVAQARRRA
jgi:hypothetical protein